MKPLLRWTATTVFAVALMVPLLPADAHAQARHAVPRPVPSHPIGYGGAYRGPVVHHPYYATPYFYGAYYYPYYYPFSFSVGFGCCGYPYYGYPYYPYYGGYPYAYDSSLRLQVTPREAEVFVDGYYAGIVDDFDGAFQRLTLEVGPHRIELDAQGTDPRFFDVYVDPARTVDIHADLFR